MHLFFTTCTVLVAIAVVACAGAPPPVRPNLPETFESSGVVTIRNGTRGLVWGNTWYYWSQPTGKSLHVLTFDNPDNNVYELQRYDQGWAYTVTNAGGRRVCRAKRTDGKTMPPMWAWVAKASFLQVYNDTNNNVFNMWKYQPSANENLEVAVPVSQPNVLGYYWAFSPYPGPRYTYQADHFSPTSPASSRFDVPKECGHKPVVDIN